MKNVSVEVENGDMRHAPGRSARSGPEASQSRAAKGVAVTGGKGRRGREVEEAVAGVYPLWPKECLAF